MDIQLKFPLPHDEYSAARQWADRVEGLILRANETIRVGVHPGDTYYICIELEANRVAEVATELLEEGYID